MGICLKFLLAGCLILIVGVLSVFAQTNAGNISLVTKEISLGKVPVMANLEAMVISPDKRHVAYPVMRGGKWTLFHDGKEGPKYDRVSEQDCIRFSPDSQRLAYAARRGDKWLAVVDGKEDPEFDDIAKNFPLFSPNSRRVAYIAKSGKEWIIVVDGKEVSSYVPIGAPLFESPNKIAIVAGRLDESFNNEVVRLEIEIVGKP